MDVPDYCKSLLIDLASPKKHSPVKVVDKDEISVLLDNVPEVDSAFTVTKIIGHGTFSSVYLGRAKENFESKGRHYFALKHIIPTSHPLRVYMELKCLKLMGGKNNVIEASHCFRHMNHIVLVMPYMFHDSFMDYVGDLSVEEICDYIKNLLIALKQVHSFNIIHRDIKPANFLYSRKYRRYSLIDFGLAQEVKNSCEDIKSASCNGGKQIKFSPPTSQLPPHSVKRKLTISNCSPLPLSDGGASASKKARLDIHDSAVSSPLSTRINSNVVRRSPRKLCSISAKKENTPLTPKKKETTMEESLKDSPSKHTRYAEACRSSKNSNESSETGSKSKLSLMGHFTPAILGSNAVRKSPRKSMNSPCWNPNARGLNDSVDMSSRNSGFESSALPPSVSSLSKSTKGDSNRRSSTLKEVNSSSAKRAIHVSYCRCYGSAKVCKECLGRKNEQAPRAGTPGFRAPEVLLRHPNQTTAVDMWSSGVILVCLLSGRYPFFRAVDDLSSLAEIATLLGSKTIKRSSSYLGKLFTSSDDMPVLDLRKVCEKLRNQKSHANDVTLNGQAKPEPLCGRCKQVESDCVCLNPPPKELSTPTASTNSKLPLSTLQNPNPEHLSNNFQPIPSKIESQVLPVPSTSAASDGKSEHSNNGVRSPQVTSYPSSSRSNLVPSSSSRSPLVPRYPSLVYNLLHRLMDPNPDTRITAEEALRHPFIAHYSKSKSSSSSS